MKTLFRLFPMAFLAVLFTVTMTGCAALGDVFKAGAYTGIIGVVVVVGLVIWLLSKFMGGGNRNA